MAKEVERRRRQQFSCRPAQTFLRVGQRVVDAGQEILVVGETLEGSGTMFLDMYWRGVQVFVANERVRRGRAEFKVKVPDVDGVVILQAYMDMVDPGQAVSVKALYVRGVEKVVKVREGKVEEGKVEKGEGEKGKGKRKGKRKGEKMEKVQWARVGRAVLGEVAERLREMAERYAQRLTARSLERKEKKRKF